MKFILIGIYLAHGGSLPTYDRLTFDTLKECRAVAKDYISKAVAGQKWAICTKIREKGQ
jgi:predicted RNase H-like nuclease